MFREYLGEILLHKPDRSGFPSAVRGAGADKFGLPSAVRGMPGVGYFSHCAESVALVSNSAAIEIQRIFMSIPYCPLGGAAGAGAAAGAPRAPLPPPAGAGA